MESLGRGTGGVIDKDWFYIPWSKSINSGSCRVAGKKVSRKLTALELVGPLVALTNCAIGLRGHPVTIWVDNAGSVAVWNKGYSHHCLLSNTLVKAISTVAAGLGCQLCIKKITRCSNTGAVLADFLSKAMFSDFRSYASVSGWPLHVAPSRTPPVLLRWIDRPHVDDLLGLRILSYLSSSVPVLGMS